MNLQLLIRRIFLICYDICAVVAASVLAILVRFDFKPESVPDIYVEKLWDILGISVLLTIIVFAVFRLYSSLWSYAGTTEMLYIMSACVVASVVNMLLIIICHRGPDYPLPRSFYLLYALFLMCFTVFGRYSYRGLRFLRNRLNGNRENERNVLIIGAGSAGSALIKEIQSSQYVNKRIVGVIDDDPAKQGTFIHGIKVIGTRDNIIELAETLAVDEIMIALPSATAKQIQAIVNICKETGCELKRLPGIYQLVNGDVSISKLKDVDENDLLGREPVRVNIESIMDYVSGKTILITGGGGSIGSELCRQVAQHHPKLLVVVDIYENNAYSIQQELIQKYPDLNLVVLIASVRNTKRMDDIFRIYRPDIVYHAAAHKHVPLMEACPNEAVKNNVLGTWKVVQAADKYQVKRFVMISTDKAVNPTNIMGATKRVCEMLIQTYNNRSQTEFVAVRFGNVLGSNGSVIPLFKKQIANGGPVTVTHPDIIRYFMTIPEAVSLVLQAGAYAKGGEIFVLDMGEPVKILDLARNLIQLSGHKPDVDIPIVFTGLRPGEKLYEEMLMEEEGLQNTENQLIHIGKPLDFDEDKFMAQLEELKEYVVTEPDDIREHIRQLVPTYVINSDLDHINGEK